MKNKKLSVISFILALMMCIMCMPGAMAADDEVPTIVKMTPESGAKNVQIVKTIVEVTFSTEMDEKCLENVSSVSIDNGGKVLGLKPVNSKTTRIYLIDLMPDTTYTLKFSKGLKSAKGVPMEETSKTFTTTAKYPYHHLIPGGDMEDPIWRKHYSEGNASTINFKQDSEGNTYLNKKITWGQAPVLTWVVVEPGATYAVRAKVRSSADQNGQLRLSMKSASSTEWLWRGTSYAHALVKGEWVEMYDEFTIPLDVVSTKIDVRVIGVNANTEIDIDDFQMFEVNSDEPAPDMDFGAVVSDKLTSLVETEEVDKAAQRLVALGIYGAAEYAEDTEVVTREAFSKVMAKALGVQDVKSTQGFENYADVDENYDGHIGTMIAENILTVGENGLVDPYRAITFSEVCRAFVVALGHQGALETKSPITAASNLGIRNMTGLRATSEIRYKDLTSLLDYFLEAECLYNYFGDYKTAEVLKAKLGFTELKGIVEASSQTSLTNAQGIAKNTVKIDGKTYAVIDLDPTDLIGKMVTYYVKEIDGENTVVYFGDIEKNNKILKLNAYDVISYANNVYTYATGEQVTGKRVDVETDKAVIYNGRSTRSYQAADLVPTYGWVELIDNDKNGKYDVVKVTKYDTYVVESFEVNEGIIRDKFTNNVITIDKHGETFVYTNGKTGKFETITSNDVLTIERSMDNVRTIIYRSTAVLPGEVGDVIVDDVTGVTYVSFFDEIHGADMQKNVPAVKGYAGNTGVARGDAGTFYMDAFGQIAAFTRNQGEWTVAYLKQARIWDEEKLKIEVYTESKTHETLYAAENMRIDAYRSTDPWDAFDALAAAGASATVVEPELVMIKKNADGLVKQIKTARDTTVTDDFRQLFTRFETLNYYGTHMDNRILLNSSTRVMIVPADANVGIKSEYRVDPKEIMIGQKSYNIMPYSFGANRLTADFVVIKDQPYQNVDGVSIGLVTDIKQALNEDDEVITTVYTTNGNLKIGTHHPIDINNVQGANYGSNAGDLRLEKGDFVIFRTRLDGYLNDIRIVFKASTGTSYASTSGGNMTSPDAANLKFGRITAKEGTAIEITLTDDSTRVFDTKNFGVLYKFTREINTLEKCTANDLSEKAATNVAVLMGWNQSPYAIMVY